MIRTFFVAVATLIFAACGGNGALFASTSACDGYVACCNSMSPTTQAACLAAVERVRATPNAEAACAEQLRQWDASGTCRATQVVMDSGVADSRVAPNDATTIESGPVAVNGGYSLQALSVARRSRTNRATLDVSLRLGVETDAQSAPLTASLFRVIGDDGLERVGITGVGAQCPESALVAPGATVTCTVAFALPASVRALRLVYLAPNNTRIEALAPTEQPLPPPPLRAVLQRGSSMCEASGCDSCIDASRLLCALENPGQCADEADEVWECESVESCFSYSRFYGCMLNNERARSEVCLNAPYPSCAERSETSSRACNDNVDNDADSYIDCEDRDCCSVRFGCGPATFCGQAPETTVTLCSDSIDNDRDTFVDCEDRECCTPLRSDNRTCPYASYCGGQACPELADVYHPTNTCPAASRTTLLDCLNAATTEEADRACYAMVPSNCATCVQFGYRACVTRGTTGLCNREFNCWEACAQAVCPTGSATCREAALEGTCATHFAALSTCWEAPATQAACANSNDDCFING